MKTPPPLQHELFADYLGRFMIGLKGIDEALQREICAEITIHIAERVGQLEKEGSARPIEDALTAFGKPESLSSQFMEQVKSNGLKIGPSKAKNVTLPRQRSQGAA